MTNPLDVQVIVTDYYKLPISAMTNDQKGAGVSVPRMVAMYLSWKVLDCSFSRIGTAFSKNHTTAIHAVKVIQERLKSDSLLKAEVQALESQVRELASGRVKAGPQSVQPHYR